MAVWQPSTSTPRTVTPLHDLGMLRLVGVVAGLALAIGLLIRGNMALRSEEPARIVRVDEAGVVVDGSVQLTSDRTAPLFDDVLLAPGETVARCVTIDHAGSVGLDSVVLFLDGLSGSPDLAAALVVDVALAEGVTQGDGSCAGVATGTTLATGPLSVLAAQAADARGAWRTWEPTSGEARQVHRIAVTLPLDAANSLQGERVETSFVWSGVASPVGGDLTSRTVLLAAAAARDVALPMIILTTLGVVFLGIQDRIDRRDPKLALAPVRQEPGLFLDPEEVSR